MKAIMIGTDGMLSNGTDTDRLIRSASNMIFDSHLLAGINWSEASITSPWSLYLGEISANIIKNYGIALDRVRSRQRLIRRAVKAYAQTSATSAGKTPQKSKASFEELLELIDSAEGEELSRDLPPVLYHVLRTYIADAAIIVFIKKSISNIKRALEERPRAVFCGITWHKRTWFLLHGSHPPKTETESPSVLLWSVYS
jgi:hypothetical protein